MSEAVTISGEDDRRREALEQRIRTAPTFAELKSLLLDEQVAKDRAIIARDPERRVMLDKVVDETRQRLLAGQPLSRDAQIIQAAIETVVADRQANASADLRRDIADYAAFRLAEREERSGPIQLPQAALGVIDMDRFSAIVRGSKDLSPAQDTAPEPQAIRPIAIRTGEEMAETARLLREGSPQRQPSVAEASAAAADALAVGKLRANLEERIGGACTQAELQALLSEERFREDRRALAGHPAQVAAIAVAIEDTEAKLRAQAQRASPDTLAVASVVELTQRGSNSTAADRRPDDPPRITEAYVVRERDGERQYFQRSDGQLAIRANDTHIRGVRRDAATIGAMLDLAEARGWSDVVVRGDRGVARETWIQATMRGLAVEGYKPTRDDIHALEQRRAGVPSPPHLDIPEASPASGLPVTPVPPRRSSKEPWMDREGGFDTLPSVLQDSAARSYERWASENPELGRRHDLRDYVSYVQEQRALERGDLKQTPPKVELPRPGLGL